MLSIDPGDAEAAAMPPHQRRGRIVQAVTALLLRLSERSPLALAVEDLHWIDPQSEEVLRALVEGIAAPLCWCCSRTGPATRLRSRTRPMCRGSRCAV